MKTKEEIQDLLIQIEDNLAILNSKSTRLADADPHVCFNNFKQEILALAWRDALRWVAEFDEEEQPVAEQEISLADYTVSKKQRRS